MSASSQHKDYSPSHLLGAAGRVIWHAERNPNYPQWVQIKHSTPQRFSTISIKRQTSSKVDVTSRAPKHFIFQGSDDAKNWTDLIEVKDSGFTSKKAWATFQFKNEKKYTFYRIYILANGGDPSFLTIQQIALN